MADTLRVSLALFGEEIKQKRKLCWPRIGRSIDLRYLINEQGYTFYLAGSVIGDQSILSRIREKFCRCSRLDGIEKKLMILSQEKKLFNQGILKK